MAKEESASKRSKEEKEEPENEPPQEQAKDKKSQETEPQMEQMILNSAMNKYDAILLARRWAYELKSKDQEARSIQELIPQAIKDVLGARVSQKMIRDLPVLKPVVKKQKASPASLLDNIGKAPAEAAPDEDDEKPKSKKKS